MRGAGCAPRSGDRRGQDLLQLCNNETGWELLLSESPQAAGCCRSGAAASAFVPPGQCPFAKEPKSEIWRDGPPVTARSGRGMKSDWLGAVRKRGRRCRGGGGADELPKEETLSPPWLCLKLNDDPDGSCFPVLPAARRAE